MIDKFIHWLKELFAGKKENLPVSHHNNGLESLSNYNRGFSYDNNIWGILSGHLKNGDKITFKWDSGNDEAFVYVSINDKEIEDDNDNFLNEEIGNMLIMKLDIPDAGEFSMEGKGDIIIKNNRIVARYSSEIKGMIDYDEENDVEIFSEVEHDSGEKVLNDLVN